MYWTVYRVSSNKVFDKGPTSRLFAMEVIGGALHIGGLSKRRS